MKEIEFNPRLESEVRIEQRKQVEHQLIGNIIPHKGHKIWEIDEKTKEVREASYTKSEYVVGGEAKREIIVKKNCTYVSALNPKNALKKYKNGENGGRKHKGWTFAY